MRIIDLLRKLIRGQDAAPAPKSLEGSVREIQQKFMNAARENGKPRIGA